MPRRPGRFLYQPKEYLKACSQADADTVDATLDMINADESLTSVPTTTSLTRPGTMVSLMTNGLLLAWRPFRDNTSLYEVTYIGNGEDC